MQPLARGAAVIVAGLLFGCARQTVPEPRPTPEPTVSAPPTPAPTRRPAPPPRNVATIVDTIFLLTNRERERADLTPLRLNPALARAAQLQAEQMAAAGKLSHSVSGSRYPTLASRL
jgi:uncharacterized protein YkwD